MEGKFLLLYLLNVRFEKLLTQKKARQGSGTSVSRCLHPQWKMPRVIPRVKKMPSMEVHWAEFVVFLGLLVWDAGRDLWPLCQSVCLQ